MGKLDPTAYDRWWRSRIDKEEASYGEGKKKQKQPLEDNLVLNTLGSPQLVPPSATETQQLRAAAAAVVHKAQSISLADLAGPISKHSSRAGSIAAGARGNGKADSIASGYLPVGSHISYPRTPQFSQAGSMADAEIINRLMRLEKDLDAEKGKREAAEKEMKELMSLASTKRK